MKHLKRRRLSLALVVLLAGGLLSLAPTPSLSAQREMKVDTETVPASAGGIARHAGVDQFRMIGVSWDGAEPSPLRVRVRTAGKWGEWKEVEASEGPDSGTRERQHARLASEPIWVGRADGYEVDHGSGATRLSVHLVREGSRRIRISTSVPSAHADSPMPPINTRSSWGARPPKDVVEYADGVATAFVHHTVNANDYAAGDVPAILRSIQAYHMDTNGWNDIGYNFLVDRFGGMWEGRGGGMDKPVIGAHTLGFNTRSTGVAVIGDFSGVNPPDAALQGVGRVIAWKFSLNGVDPAGSNVMTSSDSGSKYPAGTKVTVNNISGHRDVFETSCPGLLYNFLPQIRSIARGWWGAFFAYDMRFRGGVFSAAGDFTSDPGAELITGADAGGGPDVGVFRNDGLKLNGFFAFGAGFRGGVRVATGRAEGTNQTLDLIAAAGQGGGPDVRIYHADGRLVRNFFAYGASFTGGVYPALGNVNALSVGDEIVTGPGPGGGPDVRVFAGTGGLLSSFLAYGGGFRGGVRVATGDLNGDGTKEIITAPGPGGGPNVRVFRADGTMIGNFMPYSVNFTGGVYVSTVRSPDGKKDLIVTGAGEGGGPHVRVFALDGQNFGNFLVQGNDDTTGTRVAGGNFIGSAPGQIAITRGPGSTPMVNYRRLDGSAFFP